MKISAIKIYNVRSFLDEDNYLMLEDGKTAIIGVNESGKSNILDAIGHLNFTTKLGDYYNKNKNLSVPEEDVKLLVQLHMNENEMHQMGVTDDSEKTLLTFSVGQATTISGTLSHAIANRETIKRAVEFWDTHVLNDFYIITNDNRSSYNNALQLIKKCSCEIIPLSQLEVLTRNWKKDIDAKECIECISDLKTELEKIYFMFPTIMYKQWNGVVPVKAAYVNTEVVKELTDSNSSLYKLTRAAGIDINEMKQAFELAESNARHTLRYKIEKAIREKVCDEFKRFYPKSELDLLVKFEANKLYVNVMTGGMVMSIGERSNGLRWYLGLFIELMAMDYKNRDVLFLLDEPGVFLHVNAQKELLELFDELCENRGQLIYTTHLPYMLDTENIYCIRRVEKDDNGQSHIYNRVYAGGLDLPSRQETLTPLIQAMGCDMKYSMDFSTKRNVVTEGITDRMYLEAAMISLGITDAINIIPSNGAAAIPNIVSILIGWGCDYKIILDYDTEGFTQYNRLLKGFGKEIEDKIVFVVEGNVPEDVNDRTINMKTIESIISETNANQMVTPYDGSEKTKTIAAMEFRSKIMSGEIIMDEMTKNGFQRLFVELNVISL